MASDLTIKIVVSQASVKALRTHIDGLKSAALECRDKLPLLARESLQRFFDSPDLADKLVRVETDFITAYATEMSVCFYPTDLLCVLPAAIRAGNVDGLIIEKGHSESPV